MSMRNSAMMPAPEAGSEGKSAAFAGTLFQSLLPVALAAAFVISAAVYAYAQPMVSAANPEFALWIAVAAGFGAYMAINIGANDVANNIGPIVGSRVMTMYWALVMAAICEFAGAVIAGGEVTGTVRGGIVSPLAFTEGRVYVWVMMAALLAAALWLNVATMLGAPVSTTHSIVGGVVGGGIAAAGVGVVNWPVMANIAASWIVSPLLGAFTAAALLYGIKRLITYRSDIKAAAMIGVPFLVASMAAVFTCYLAFKGLSKIWKVGAPTALGLAAFVGALAWLAMRAFIASGADQLDNSKDAVNSLLTVPLILAGGLLCFAHGSNDVANAIAPLAGIIGVLTSGALGGQAAVPIWVMILGALGLSIGLLLFGPRVVRTIGTEITEIDAMRAYCIAMAATLTVITASELGLPVSTTHVTVGAVVGVGFLREWIKTRHDRLVAEIRSHHPEGDEAAVQRFLERFYSTPLAERKQLLRDLKEDAKLRDDPIAKADRKSLARAHKQALVSRALIIKIFAAWITTVPCTALISGLLYFTLRGMMI